MTKSEKEMGIEKPKHKPIPHPERHGHKKKDTKRWCKGVVGREHTPVIEPNDRWKTGCDPTREWQILRCVEQERCTTCDKILTWNLGSRCTKLLTPANPNI